MTVYDMIGFLQDYYLNMDDVETVSLWSCDAEETIWSGSVDELEDEQEEMTAWSFEVHNYSILVINVD